MKKTITIIALAALFVSCAKEAEQTPATSGDVVTVAPTEFSAILETPESESDTKTTLDTNGKTVLWESGDAISVWPGVFAQAKYTLSSGAGTTSATFTSDQTITGDPVPYNVALYPYDGDVVLTVDGAGLPVLKNVKHPAVQNYRENSWDKGAMTMLGVDSPDSLSTNSLSFLNFEGVLRLTLKGTATIDSIRVSALGADEYIAGVVNLDFSKEVKFTSGKKTVTLKCGESGVKLSKTEGTVFNIVIPPIAGGFKVTIYDNAHGFMELKSNSRINRNTILKMPEKTYAPTAMDLGLSVYWATCNVGATTPEGYGDFFAWGETTAKETYGLNTYKWTEDGGSTFTKYNGTDGKTILDPEDDAATANWGAAWRMPTIAEFEELENNCDWTWTTQNGVKGCKVVSKKTGYEGASIFLPVAGDCDKNGSRNVGTGGCFRTKQLIFIPLFAPAVEPVVEFAMPEQGVLGLENPVVLFGEDEKFARYAHHLCGIESCHALLVRDAEVHHAVDAEYGSMPLGDIALGVVGVVTACLGRGCVRRSCLLHASECDSVTGGTGLTLFVGVLRQASVVPVGKPHLLRRVPEGLLVEYSSVSDEAVVEVDVETLKHIRGDF